MFFSARNAGLANLLVILLVAATLIIVSNSEPYGDSDYQNLDDNEEEEAPRGPISDVQPSTTDELDEDKRDRICSLPPKTGMCLALFIRWYYNPDLAKCDKFLYGGCQANENNFRTLEECEQMCNSPVASPDQGAADEISRAQESRARSSRAENEICRLRAQTGFCRGYVPSWFYDHSTGECAKFIYGGCGGNANRFESREQCEQSCSSNM